MAAPAVIFDGVWKKFRRGERHDSLRDLVPAAVKRLVRGRRDVDQLDDQEFWALRDLSFEVRPGEALGIIGPNGAGKSTTLKLLTKILKPTKGRCEVRGRVGALIELAAGFHPDLTGRENVYLQGAIMGMSRADTTKRFDAIVAFAGVEEFIDTQVKRYSSGMQARLGFAIAAHLDPDVLLIDEVLSVGDYSFQQKCHERLERFRHEGVPIVFVSHNLQAIASLAGGVLLLRPRCEPVVGPTAQVLSLYRSPPSAVAGDRVVLKQATLRSSDGLSVPQTVRPAAGLVLDAAIEARASLPRCCVGVEVVRQDGTVMFAGSPAFEGAAPIDVPADSRLDVRIAFRANVLKGVYTIHLHLVDDTRTWPPLALRSVAEFTVHETTRVGGVAELEPVFTMAIRHSGSIESEQPCGSHNGEPHVGRLAGDSTPHSQLARA